MLKGQLSVPTEFTIGSMIYMIIIILISSLIVAPLFYVSWEAGTSEVRLNVFEYANLARQRLTEVLGNGEGDIWFPTMQSNVALGTSQLGIARNVLVLEELTSGNKWTFSSGDEKHRHDVYTTMQSPYFPVTSPTYEILSKDEVRLFHIYADVGEGRDVVVGVYEGGYSCSKTSRIIIPQTTYSLLSCNDIDDAEYVEADAGDIRNMIASVRNSGGYVVKLVKAKSDILSKDIVPSGLVLGDSWSCPMSGKDYLCLRRVGDFVFPLKIHVEMDKDAEIA